MTVGYYEIAASTGELFEQIALDIRDEFGNRARSYSSRMVNAGTVPFLSSLADLRHFDCKLFVHVVMLAGNDPPDGFDHPAISDSADQLADQLNTTPGYVRNALSRLYAAGVLAWAPGRILWRKPRRVFKPARPRRRQDRVLHATADYAAAAWRWADVCHQ